MSRHPPKSSHCDGLDAVIQQHLTVAPSMVAFMAEAIRLMKSRTEHWAPRPSRREAESLHDAIALIRKALADPRCGVAADPDYADRIDDGLDLLAVLRDRNPVPPLPDRSSRLPRGQDTVAAPGWLGWCRERVAERVPCRERVASCAS